MLALILGFLLSFICTWAVGGYVIRWLRALKAGQTIKEIGPVWHKGKEGTPTMGGIMFLIGIVVTLIVMTVAGRLDDFSAWYVFAFSMVFAAIGLFDDYQKVKHHRNEGLTAAQKALLQLIAAVIYILVLGMTEHISNLVYVPFFNVSFTLPWPVYAVFAAFVIVGCVNSVNLTDGVDGLATGVTMPVGVVFAAVAMLWWHSGLGVLSAAMFGGLVAFLLYNFHPAKVFMGDTGSLFLGGMVCGLAFALDIPLVLVLVGIIYICETLSDIIQVTYFKLTHGKRIFRMAPLHHHLELGGWSEVKLFCVFTLITVACCVLAYWGIMDRFPL